MFKAESILTLCQEFMANIKYKSATKRGKERLVRWVWGKKLKVTLDTFDEVFGISWEENLEFELSDIGMPNLATISHKLLLEEEECDGKVQCNKIRLKDRYLILFIFSYHSLLTLKRMVFMSVTRLVCCGWLARKKPLICPVWCSCPYTLYIRLQTWGFLCLLWGFSQSYLKGVKSISS